MVGTLKALDLLLEQRKLTARGWKAHTTGWVPPGCIFSNTFTVPEQLCTIPF
jgi:hypothetical protein